MTASRLFLAAFGAAALLAGLAPTAAHADGWHGGSRRDWHDDGGPRRDWHEDGGRDREWREHAWREREWRDNRRPEYVRPYAPFPYAFLPPAIIIRPW